jgi:predicted O-methyltransferase YrrM
MLDISQTITTRNELTKLINHLNLKRGVEIGVHKGVFSEHLLSNSSLETLYSIDAWLDDDDITMSARKRCDKVNDKNGRCHQETVERLEKFGQRSVIIKDLSTNAIQSFDDESLDFIYLDASHRFTGFALDMIYWWKKLKNGGVFAGHDYWRRYRYEVSYVVNAFCAEHKQLFYLTTNERTFPIYPPSWFLIKTDRKKSQYTEEFKEHKKLLLKQKEIILKEKRVMVDIPYECYD